MKRTLYTIPVVSFSLIGCGGGERVNDPIVANFNATLYDDTPLPYSYSETDPDTNVTCNFTYTLEMEVTDSLKALISEIDSVECDDGVTAASYVEADLADVTIITSGAQYKIEFGPADFLTTLDCTMDAASALQCTDQNASAWAFVLAN